jgi:DUF917 family protein
MMARRSLFRHLAWSAALGALLAETPSMAQQAKVRTLTEQELVDMMLGSSIQASRSSNTPPTVQRVKDALAQGRKFQMIAVQDLPDTWTTTTPGGAGGGGAWEYVRERTAKQNLPVVQNGNLLAAQALSKYLGKKLDAVIRTEGDGATINGLMLAADLGVPIVDACLSGRARPEVQQQIPFLNGIPAAPSANVTRWGDIIILDKAVDDYRVEDIARALAVASGGGASGVMNAMSGRDLKRGVIRGALTQAIQLGRASREAVERHADPIAAVLKVVNGFKLFEGVVAQSEMKGDRGFTWSDVTLNGTGADAGHVYRIYVKNENIVTWYDGKPDAMSPDFIQNMDAKTGDALAGPGLGAYKEGVAVVMIGWPASPLWRTPKGIEVFGPRHFGFDFDYTPLEELQKARPRSQSIR